MTKIWESFFDFRETSWRKVSARSFISPPFSNKDFFEIVHRGNERCHTVNLIDLFVLNPRTRISDKRDFFFNSGERMVTEVTPLPERAFSSFQVFLPTE